MGTRRKGGSGFSAAKPAPAPKQSATPAPAAHASKEEEAMALINQGQLQEAEAIYRELIAAGTRDHTVYSNLAAICGIQRRFDELIGLLTKALELKPDYPEAHNNLGIALKEKGVLAAAIAACTKALELRPDYPDAHNNLGNALREQGDLAAAIASFHKALEITPSFPEAQKNLSMAELLTGNYKSGWERYEYRLECKDDMGILNANPLCERWRGGSLTEGSQLLLICEQGLGDTLQFMRYCNVLRRQGVCVSLCAPSKLHALIRESGVDASPLTPQQANQVREGKWIPLLSLPRHLEVSPDHPIITEPYIKTKNELVSQWQGVLANESRPIIGLNWQGNPEHEKTNSKGRSLPLEAFAPIAAGTDVSLLALQKGFGSEQLQSCSFKDRFVSCQGKVDEAWDFLETAAIIANCDLVITSDTSVAHLAGGMGKTTWLLLQNVPDWRWGLEGDRSFWYPCMRLFRQRERGHWDEVLQRVAKALQEEFAAISAGHGASAPLKPVLSRQPTTASPQPLIEILAPISLGELMDKITILQIKTQHLQGAALENVQKELTALRATLAALDLQVDPGLIQRLKEVNADLWQMETDIREMERNKDFGEAFIQLARSVYQRNDRRSAIKREINSTYGSALVEEKAYPKY